MKILLLHVFAMVLALPLGALASNTGTEGQAELASAVESYIQNRCQLNETKLWFAGKTAGPVDVATVAASILGTKGYTFSEAEITINLTQANSHLSSVQVSLRNVPNASVTISPQWLANRVVSYRAKTVKQKTYYNIAYVDQDLNLHLIESVLIGQETWFKNASGLNAYVLYRDYLQRLHQIQPCPYNR